MIQIAPRPLDHPDIKRAYADLAEYTHLLFTSKNSVKVFLGHLALMGQPIQMLLTKTVVAIGEVTASHLRAAGLPPQFVSLEETQEGVVQLLQGVNLKGAYFFMPRSCLARPVLVNFFEQQQIRCCALDVYDTLFQAPTLKPDLNEVDVVVFTSPSTVRAFVEIFGKLPEEARCLAIGPVTAQAMVR